MSYEKRDNSGTLGANKRRENDKHPTHTGAATINGTDYWISAWVKENKSSGEKFFSLSFKQKEGQAAIERPAQPDYDDQIPF